MERKIVYSLDTKTTFRDFWDRGILLKKIPIPEIWDFSGFWLRDFSGESIEEFGSQKNPIPKQPLR